MSDVTAEEKVATCRQGHRLPEMAFHTKTLAGMLLIRTADMHVGWDGNFFCWGERTVIQIPTSFLGLHKTFHFLLMYVDTHLCGNVGIGTSLLSLPRPRAIKVCKRNNVGLPSGQEVCGRDLHSRGAAGCWHLDPEAGVCALRGGSGGSLGRAQACHDA